MVALAAAAPAISPTPVALNWKVSNWLYMKQVSYFGNSLKGRHLYSIMS